MIRFTRTQLLPIGLDIGHDSIKMLQMEVVGGALSVVAAAQSQFPEDTPSEPSLRMAIATDTVRRMFRQHHFKGRDVVIALPPEIVHTKNLRLPMMPANDLNAAVEFETRNIFQFEADQARIKFLPAGEVRQGTEISQEVIVFAAKYEDVNNYIEQFHRCGLTIGSVDIEPCALYRSIERFIRRREDEQQVHVIVDIGAYRTQVVIGKGHEITFYKSLDIGGHHLDEAVSQKLGVSLTEAQALRRRLAKADETTDPNWKRDPVRQAIFDAVRGSTEQLGREISLCLRYYLVTFRGCRPTRVRLVGGEATDPHLQAMLNASLTIPIEPGRPLYSVDISRMKATDRGGAMSEWATAFGLALKLTNEYFGARDGKPRLPLSAKSDNRAVSSAQVVDLNRMIQQSPDASVAAPSPVPQSSAREVAHA